jgi:hypothetical protein
VKSYAGFAGACVAIIAIIGAAAALFTGPEARQAILASGLVALVVQLAAFSVTRLLQPAHAMVGWGIGSGMRFIALVLYALVVAKLWQPPVAAALLSFVGFLFVTTLVEPLFLKR